MQFQFNNLWKFCDPVAMIMNSGDISASPFLLDGHYHATNYEISLRVPEAMVAGEVFGLYQGDIPEKTVSFAYLSGGQEKGNYPFHLPPMVNCPCTHGTVLGWGDDETLNLCPTCYGTKKHVLFHHNGENHYVHTARLADTCYVKLPYYALVAEMLEGISPVVISMPCHGDRTLRCAFEAAGMCIVMRTGYSRREPECYWDARTGEFVVNERITPDFPF